MRDVFYGIFQNDKGMTLSFVLADVKNNNIWLAVDREPGNEIWLQINCQ